MTEKAIEAAGSYVQDAMRYRWLRDVSHTTPDSPVALDIDGDAFPSSDPDAPGIDQVIDKAMKQAYQTTSPNAVSALESANRQVEHLRTQLANRSVRPCQQHEWASTPVCLICGVEWKDTEESK